MDYTKQIAKLQRDIEEILGHVRMLELERKNAVVELMAVALTFAMERLEEGMREYMETLNKSIAPVHDESSEDVFKNEYQCIPLPPDEEGK